MIIKNYENSVCPLVEAAICIANNGKGYDIDNSNIWTGWVKDYLIKRIKK